MSFGVLAWGVAFLVLFKNSMADMPHPDNLHALHAVGVFWLCWLALETRRFGLAIVTMMVAGVGVFTKQTEAFCFLGPGLAFAVLKPWGWRRWLLLVGLGGLTTMISLYLLWLPAYAPFYTYDLTAHQGFSARKLYSWTADLLSMDRGLLLFLGVAAGLCLWSGGGVARRYLVCWMSVGCFAVLPNLAAYFKTMGTWNNLIIFQIWLVLIVWPFFGVVLDEMSAERSSLQKTGVGRWPRPGMALALSLLTLMFIVLLLPTKLPPGRAERAYCETLEAAVRADIAAGRRVLVAHGTTVLLRAGASEVPLDRANSLLELNAAGMGGQSEMRTRINAHYYDRIYLTMPDWYGEPIVNDIERNYREESVIRGVAAKGGPAFGFQGLMRECRILGLRTEPVGPW